MYRSSAPTATCCAGAAPGAGAELIADPARDRLLLFGGRGSDGGFADLWELSGNLPAP